MLSKTLIDGKIAEIHVREEEHDLGKNNGGNPHLWAKVFHNNEDQSAGFEWVPWLDSGCNRPCFGLDISEDNIRRYKWGGDSVYARCTATITCNNRVIYQFFGRNVQECTIKASYILQKLEAHPFNFSNPEEEIGRKIWYHQQPAIISGLMLDQGCILIKHAHGEPFNLSKPWDDDDIDNVWDGKTEVKDDILTEEIFWFRSPE